jgi:hypothetical protein
MVTRDCYGDEYPGDDFPLNGIMDLVYWGANRLGEE